MPMNLKRKKVLFLCTGNSCRSQMAEGWARFLKGDVLEPYSAGTVARGLDQRAVKVMAEAGVDISGQRSKRIEELEGVQFDLVVTLCGHAQEHCPVFTGGTKVAHFPIFDPPALAREARSEEEILAHYRRARNEIRNLVEDLPYGIEEPAPQVTDASAEMCGRE